MKMDILYWKNLSKKIRLVHTKKQFYKQYLYKLEIYAPGCKSIREDNIPASLDRRLTFARDYNYGGSWVSSRMKTYLQEADAEFLHLLKDISPDYPQLKFITQEPKYQVYGNSEADIRNFVNALPSEYKDSIILLSYPEDSEAEQLLSQNCILKKRQPKFTHKIIFRERQFPNQSRLQIYNYLLSLGDIVQIPPHTKEQLTKGHGWLWGTYFYSNDPGIADFLKLIEPNLIREVCPLVYTV